MTSREVTITHEGKTYMGQVATIDSTFLGWEDHGILTAYLQCNWPGMGIGVGGFGLDKSTGAPDYARVGTAYGLDHIMRLMQTVGVHKWEDLKGKTVIILFEQDDPWGSGAKGIAHHLEDKVFILSAHAEQWRNENG